MDQIIVDFHHLGDSVSEPVRKLVLLQTASQHLGSWFTYTADDAGQFQQPQTSRLFDFSG